MRQRFFLVGILLNSIVLASGPVRTEAVRSVRFSNSACSWVAGDAGIFRTQDGGHSWSPADAGLVSQLPAETGGAEGTLVTNASSSDCHSIWAIVRYTSLWKSVDNGRRWENVTPAAYLSDADQYGWQRLEQVVVIDSRTAFIEATHTLFTTSNGGISWEALELPWTDNPLRYKRVQFLDKQNGWCTDERRPPQFWATRNGGYSWKKVRITLSNKPLDRVFLSWLRFFSPQDGYVLLYSTIPRQGELFRTKDGGKSWVPQYMNLHGFDAKPSLANFALMPGGRVLAAGVVESDGLRVPGIGPVPTLLLLAFDPPSAPPRAIYKTKGDSLFPFFLTTAIGWVITWDGPSDFRVTGTLDGGQTWYSPVTVPTQQNQPAARREGK